MLIEAVLFFVLGWMAHRYASPILGLLKRTDRKINKIIDEAGKDI